MSRAALLVFRCWHRSPQEPPATPAAPPAPPDRTPPGEPRPYERVITKDAKSQTGLFTVHRIGERVYYEIPKAQLGKEFLWVSQIARTTLGAGEGGQAAGNRVVKWERRNNRVILRSISYAIVAERSQPIARAVEAANNDSILMAFNVEAVGKDEAPVIELTRLFSTEVPEFSARARVRSQTFDANRSFVERVSAFPENIEVEATHTYSTGVQIQNAAPQANPQNAARQQRLDRAYSMVKLPEADDAQAVRRARRLLRCSKWITARTSIGVGRHHRALAPRKKDPAAAVSEPRSRSSTTSIRRAHQVGAILKRASSRQAAFEGGFRTRL